MDQIQEKFNKMLDKNKEIEPIYPKKIYRIKKLNITCSLCPFQMEGKTKRGKYIYIRERFNVLRIEIDGKVVYKEYIEGGINNYEELKEHTNGFFEWPIIKDIICGSEYQGL